MNIRSYSEIKDIVNSPIRHRSKIINRRGNEITPRKYHMTTKQMDKTRRLFREETKKVGLRIKNKAGKRFFNPYRRVGAFYGCVQSLYLLGANKWHDLISVRKKMQELMSEIYGNNGINAWIKFDRRQPKRHTISSKDTLGRIQNNMAMLNRLGGLNPYGLKLKQTWASVDIKRDESGIWSYRLRTNYKSFKDVAPTYDTKKR